MTGRFVFVVDCCGSVVVVADGQAGVASWLEAGKSWVVGREKAVSCVEDSLVAASSAYTHVAVAGVAAQACMAWAS